MPDEAKTLDADRKRLSQQVGSIGAQLALADGTIPDIAALQALAATLHSELVKAARRSPLRGITSHASSASRYRSVEEGLRQLIARWGQAQLAGRDAPPIEEFGALLGIAEKVMGMALAAAKANPSNENFLACQLAMADLSLLAQDISKDWGEVRAIAEHQLRVAISLLEAEGSAPGLGQGVHAMEAALDEVLRRVAVAQAFGADAAVESALTSARKCAVQFLRRTDRQFRAVCSAANYRALVRAHVVLQTRFHDPSIGLEPPAGFRDAPIGTTHVVKVGESLPSISDRYYGSPAYWDVIVLRNADLIRDPGLLPIGAKLRIN